MTVLIKGMNFPKTCRECDLEIVDDEDYTTYCYCPLIYKGFTGKCREDGRLPDCPLVEVPDEQPEIIRCKYCENWDTSWECSSGPDYHYCGMADKNTASTFYCGDAERRANGDSD